MFRVSQHPSSGVLKTVTAVSGTGHNTGKAISLQRGWVGMCACVCVRVCVCVCVSVVHSKQELEVGVYYNTLLHCILSF